MLPLADGRSRILLWKEAISSFCGEKQMLPSAEGSSCLLPWKEANTSIGGRKEWRPSAGGRNNCLLTWKEAFPSLGGRNDSHPSAQGSNYFLLQMEAIASFRGRKQLPANHGLGRRELALPAHGLCMRGGCSFLGLPMGWMSNSRWRCQSAGGAKLRLFCPSISDCSLILHRF